MKTKTSELAGAALDWAVAKCEDESVRVAGGRVRFALSQFTNDYDLYSPSTDWAQGGPIIDRAIREDGLDLWSRCSPVPDGMCAATYTRGVPVCYVYGPTPLIAAMRCIVASNLGDDVDVPEELL